MPLADKERQTFFFPRRQKNLQVAELVAAEQQNSVGRNKIKKYRATTRPQLNRMNRINVGGLFDHVGAMDSPPGGQREADSPDSAKAIFKNVHEDCECVVTSFNFGVKAIFYKHNRCLVSVNCKPPPLTPRSACVLCLLLRAMLRCASVLTSA